MRRIGVFLGYAPEQPLRNQGIGRLLAALLKQWSEVDDLAIVIGCPLWYRHSVESLFGDHEIPVDRIEFLTTPSIPAVVALKRHWDAWRYRQRRPARLLPQTRAWLRRLARRAAIYIFASPSLPSFFGRALLALPFALIALPFLLAGAMISAALAASRHILRVLRARSPMMQKLVALVNSPLPALKRSRYAVFVYEAARGAELQRLIDLINRRRDIDLWYVPAMFWPEVQKLRAPTVIAAPDVVHVDFPSRFAEPYQLSALRRVRQAAVRATHLICYSEDVLHRHVIDALGVPPDRCTVINHGYDGMSELRYIDAAVASPADVRHYCEGVLRDFQRSHLYGDPYLADLDFASLSFFLYSSQVRPHKNHLALLQAFELNLRRNYVNAKLIVTGDLLSAGEIADFYYVRRLGYDVLILKDVPNEVLVALNCLAVCAVNPSLFEGGFPFTFAEAYSVGTPSVMASIPVTLEQVRDPGLRRLMLFNPYVVNDMAERMAFAYRNRDALINAQAPLYRSLAQRTWSVAAADYLRLFARISERQRATIEPLAMRETTGA